MIEWKRLHDELLQTTKGRVIVAFIVGVVFVIASVLMDAFLFSY